MIWNLDIMKLDFVYLIIGAIFGVIVRYKITGETLFFGSLPISILIINIIGSFILGITSTAVGRLSLDPRYSLLIGVGCCGTLTTMSSFALETVNFLIIGKLLLAIFDVMLNVGASLATVFLGRLVVLVLLGVV
jgi:CrcB protein